MGDVVRLDDRRETSEVSRVEALVFEILLHSRGIAWRRPRSARGGVVRLAGRR